MPIGSPPLAFTDYRPTPDGQGTMFRQPDGREFMSFGPDADALRRQIDENRPPDQRTAFNDAAPFGSAESVPDAQGPMGPPEPPRQGVTVPEPVRQGTTTVEPPTRSQAPAAPPSGDIPPPPADLPEPAGAPAAGAAPGGPQRAQMPDIGGRVSFGAYDPSKDAARAVGIPTASTITTKGALNSPEAQAAAEASYGKRNAAMEQLATVEEQGAQLRIAQNQQAIAAADADRARLADEAMQLHVRRDMIETKFNKAMGDAQRDYELQTTRKVDQDRIWQGKDGARIVSMIGVALGALGQAILGGKNEALEIVNRRIDNDIQSQRDEIARGTQRAGNGIAALKERYGVGTEEAAAMLKMNYTRQVDAMAQKRAAMDGTPAAMQQLAKIRPELAKWQADAQDALRAKIAGDVTSSQTMKMVTPHGAGSREMTLKERAEAAGYQAKIAEATNVVEHRGVKFDEFGTAAKAQAKGQSEGGYTAQTISAINAGEVAEHALISAAESAGMKVAPDGSTTVVDRVAYLKAINDPTSLWSRKIAAAVPEIGRGLSGAKMSEEESKELHGEFSGMLKIPNAVEAYVGQLRSARRVRTESKKLKAVGGASGGGDDSGDGGER